MGDDIDDIDEGDSAGGAGPGAGPPVDDFDLGMPEEDRKKQMNACFIHTVTRMQSNREEVERTVQEIVQSQQSQQLTQQQAINSLMFSWMMTCYMNIDANGI